MRSIDRLSLVRLFVLTKATLVSNGRPNVERSATLFNFRVGVNVEQSTVVLIRSRWS